MTGGRWLVVATAIATTALTMSPAIAVEHVHSSSRYDRSADSLRTAAHRYARVARLVTWTEVSAPHRSAVLHRMRGWRSYTPDGTDVAASWSRSRWKLRHQSAPVLSPHHFTTTGGHRSMTQRAAVLLLQRRTDGRRVLLIVAHLPARPHESAARGLVWRTALDQLGELVPQLRRRWAPALTLVSADWNVDPRAVRRAFPGLSLTWRGDPPGVDGTYSDGRGRARSMVDDDSSDHRPYAERVHRVRRER